MSVPSWSSLPCLGTQYHFINPSVCSQVWGSQAGHAMALQPWGPEHAKNGSGDHFHPGCQGTSTPVQCYYFPVPEKFTSPSACQFKLHSIFQNSRLIRGLRLTFEACRWVMVDTQRQSLAVYFVLFLLTAFYWTDCPAWGWALHCQGKSITYSVPTLGSAHLWTLFQTSVVFLLMLCISKQENASGECLMQPLGCCLGCSYLCGHLVSKPVDGHSL